MECPGEESSKKTETNESCFICNTEFSSNSELASHLLDHSKEEKFQVLLAELNSRIEKNQTSVAPFQENKQFRREYIRRNYARKFSGRKQLSASTVEPEVVDILSDDDEPNNNESDPKKAKLSEELPAKPAATPESNIPPPTIPPPTVIPPTVIPPTVPPPNFQVPEITPSFNCATCKSKFNDASSLQKHMSTHDASRPFMCYICKKGFPYKGTLRQHLRMHISERSHECRFCPRKFTMKSILRKHEEQHEMQHHSELKKK